MAGWVWRAWAKLACVQRVHCEGTIFGLKSFSSLVRSAQSLRTVSFWLFLLPTLTAPRDVTHKDLGPSNPVLCPSTTIIGALCCTAHGSC